MLSSEIPRELTPRGNRGRAMPMWLAAIGGAIVGGGIFNSPTVAALLVVPVKIALDLFGHRAEYGHFELGQPPMIRSS